MNQIVIVFASAVLGLSAVTSGAEDPPVYAGMTLSESVRQHEERFIRSLFEVYAQAIRRSDTEASTAIDHFFHASAMEEFSVRSFANVVTTPHLNNLLALSQPESTEVVFDLVSVLYAIDLHARRASGTDGIGTIFYDQADIPMTVLNEIDRNAIEAMGPDEREAVLQRIRDVDRNRQRMKERRKAADLHPQIRATACRFFKEHLAGTGPDRFVAAIAQRTRAEPASIRAWLAELDPANPGASPDQPPG